MSEALQNGQKSGRPRALVTGASAGIGACFARRLAREGYDLTLVARSIPRLEALADTLRQEGVEALVLSADLAEPSGVAAVEKYISSDDSLSLLVNNAGFGSAGAFEALDPQGEEGQIRVNIIALIRLTRATIPAMKARGKGAIINVSSLAGFLPGPYSATYSATKAFVTSFTEAISEEIKGSGLQIQALCPGFTRTEFQERAHINTSKLPGFVWMEPEEVIEASLKALRQGEVVCVPGLGNRLAGVVAQRSPRRLVRRVAGLLGRRL